MINAIFVLKSGRIERTFDSLREFKLFHLYVRDHYSLLNYTYTWDKAL